MKLLARFFVDPSTSPFNTASLISFSMLLMVCSILPLFCANIITPVTTINTTDTVMRFIDSSALQFFENRSFAVTSIRRTKSKINWGLESQYKGRRGCCFSFREWKTFLLLLVKTTNLAAVESVLKTDQAKSATEA